MTDLGLSFIPSAGNFICINFERDAMPINDALLKQGIIVRPVANYDLPTYLRVTVGNKNLFVTVAQRHRENQVKHKQTIQIIYL
jgi:histidinol-phosphate/aromatic aminotransferase/cobyric acid decarboxylase-like protein